jgi:hypothetical protein
MESTVSMPAHDEPSHDAPAHDEPAPDATTQVEDL